MKRTRLLVLMTSLLVTALVTFSVITSPVQAQTTCFYTSRCYPEARCATCAPGKIQTQVCTYAMILRCCTFPNCTETCQCTSGWSFTGSCGACGN